MLNIATAWLHETSVQPLEIFDDPLRGKCILKWTPGNGHSYTVAFLEFQDIVEERTEIPKGELTVLMWSSGARAKIYAASILRNGDFIDAEIKKLFGVSGHRLTALSAIIHLALPEFDKKMGMVKAKKLRDAAPASN